MDIVVCLPRSARMKNCNERSHRAGHLRDAHAPERVKVSIDFAISAPNPLLSSNAELGDSGQRSASAQRWSLAAIAATGGFSNTLRAGRTSGWSRFTVPARPVRSDQTILRIDLAAAVPSKVAQAETGTKVRRPSGCKYPQSSCSFHPQSWWIMG
jgi:hypothetical protein